MNGSAIVNSQPWKRFGGHKGQQGLGPIAVELCCLFDLVSRATLHFTYDKCCTSEHKLIQQFIRVLKKRDLLLIDSGFYSFATFQKILRRSAHFVIPAKKTLRFKVLNTLGPGDYLCMVDDSNSNATLTVRVLYVYRKGFRRRRLVTSLLDPDLYTSKRGDPWDIIWMEFIQCCSRHRVRSKPDRQFPRDRQEYRRKSRGLEKRRPGRKPKPAPEVSIFDLRSETLKDTKGEVYLLS